MKHVASFLCIVACLFTALSMSSCRGGKGVKAVEKIFSKSPKKPVTTPKTSTPGTYSGADDAVRIMTRSGDDDDLDPNSLRYHAKHDKINLRK